MTIISFLANPYVSGFGYLIGIISGIIAIIQTLSASKKEIEIQRLNVEINKISNQLIDNTINKNNINQGERSQYFQDNNGRINIDNRR